MKTIDSRIRVKRDQVRKRVLSLFLILTTTIIALGLTGCSNGLPSASGLAKDTSMKVDSAGSRSYDLSHEFALKDTKGNLYTLSSNQGKKVYIKFWATWCPICLSGIEEFTQLSKDKASDQTVSVITIVSPGAKGEMNTQEFLDWYQKQGYEFTVLLDEGGKVAQQFSIRGYPTSMFIDPHGVIVQNRIGHLANDEVTRILESISK